MPPASQLISFSVLGLSVYVFFFFFFGLSVYISKIQSLILSIFRLLFQYPLENWTVFWMLAGIIFYQPHPTAFFMPMFYFPCNNFFNSHVRISGCIRQVSLACCGGAQQVCVSQRFPATGHPHGEPCGGSELLFTVYKA